MKTITDWAIVGRNDSDGKRVLNLEGQCEGRPIHTSRVVGQYGPSTYRTRTGSLYRLEGSPAPGYAAFCCANGIEIDLADPVKFRETAAQFEWAHVPLGEKTP